MYYVCCVLSTEACWEYKYICIHMKLICMTVCGPLLWEYLWVAVQEKTTTKPKKSDRYLVFSNPTNRISLIRDYKESGVLLKDCVVFIVFFFIKHWNCFFLCKIYWTKNKRPVNKKLKEKKTAHIIRIGNIFIKFIGRLNLIFKTNCCCLLECRCCANIF